MSPAPADAQQASPQAAAPSSKAAPKKQADSDTKEIIVTASRGRAQSLQSIPMAVSAIQASDIEAKGVGSIAEIVKSVPSVNIVERGPGQSQITIRGISSNAFSITETNDRPLTSVYVDDIPISIQGANPDLKVFDLDRIEVLRGPQGTLYGAGSMAGTIRYITVKPKVDRTFGSAEVDLGATTHANDPNWNVRGSLNLPVSPTLALLVAGYTGRDAGWIDNLGTGKKDANSSRNTQARGALRWTGIDNLTVDASLLYTHLKTDGLPVGYSGLTRYQYNSLAPEFYNEHLLIGNLATDLDLGNGHLTTSTSYLDHKWLSQTSGFDYEYLTDFIFHGVRQPSPAIIDQKVNTFTEEVRYVSNPDRRFSYSVGGFYEHSKRSYLQNNPLAGVDAATGLPSIPSFGTPIPDDLFYGTEAITETQFAVFGEGNYKITPQLDFTAGLRYFNWKQDFSLLFTGLAGSAFQRNPTGNPTYLPLSISGSPKATGFNPRFVLSYHPAKHAMIYAEASRGFRYGSLNGPIPSNFCGTTDAPASVGPDHLWNYAVGVKSQLADRKVTLNATGFYVDWRQVQTRVDLNCGYYYNVNAGHVVSKGLELETSIRPARGLTFTFNGSYTDARAQESIVIPAAAPIVAEGDRAPLFPRWIGALNAQYEFRFGRGDVTLSGDLQYRGKFSNIFSPLNANYRETPSQTIVNALINDDLGSYEIGLFGTNLTNSRNISLIDSVRDRPGTLVPPDQAIFYGRPRTVGIRAKVRF